MPCRDYMADEEQNRAARKRLDDATRAACEAISLLDNLRLLNTTATKRLSAETLAWWKEHQRQDAIRLEAERKERERASIKRKALAKLTSAEKSVLGIK
jgi:MoxR-like ATPase